jgi:hypothetical protein
MFSIRLLLLTLPGHHLPPRLLFCDCCGKRISDFRFAGSLGCRSDGRHDPIQVPSRLQTWWRRSASAKPQPRPEPHPTIPGRARSCPRYARGLTGGAHGPPDTMLMTINTFCSHCNATISCEPGHDCWCSDLPPAPEEHSDLRLQDNPRSELAIVAQRRPCSSSRRWQSSSISSSNE